MFEFLYEMWVGVNVAAAQNKLSTIAETNTWTEEMKHAYQAMRAVERARVAAIHRRQKPLRIIAMIFIGALILFAIAQGQRQ